MTHAKDSGAFLISTGILAPGLNRGLHAPELSPLTVPRRRLAESRLSGGPEFLHHIALCPATQQVNSGIIKNLHVREKHALQRGIRLPKAAFRPGPPLP